jgi:succinate dehydrogenase flavin-adding protein (antitoxin of CptAB toxin-antitoxin module)
VSLEEWEGYENILSGDDQEEYYWMVSQEPLESLKPEYHEELNYE